MFFIVFTKAKHLPVNSALDTAQKLPFFSLKNYLIILYHIVKPVRQNTLFTYFHQTCLCIFYLLPYLTDDQTLKFIVILVVSFPIYGFEFIGGNTSLRMH